MNINLRNITKSDLPIIFEHQRDPEGSAMVAVPPRDRDAFDAHWGKIMAIESNILKTIEVDGQVAGHLVSFLIEDERDVGYWLAREFWGNSLAPEALNQFWTK